MPLPDLPALAKWAGTGMKPRQRKPVLKLWTNAAEGRVVLQKEYSEGNIPEPNCRTKTGRRPENESVP